MMTHVDLPEWLKTIQEAAGITYEADDADMRLREMLLEMLPPTAKIDNVHAAYHGFQEKVQADGSRIRSDIYKLHAAMQAADGTEYYIELVGPYK